MTCHLIHVDVDASPPYKALSYVWGHPSDKVTILCGRSVLAIPRSLRDALRILRRNADTRLLWADSICINQKDVDERSQQVALMGTIYMNCTQVLVWLGESKPETMKAFEMIEKVARMAQKQRELEKDNNNWYVVKFEDLQNYDQSVLRSIVDVFERPWWSRIWCIQEFGLAAERRILCGRHKLDWTALVEFAGYMHSKGDVLALHYHLDNITKFWRSWIHFTAYKDEWRSLSTPHENEMPWSPDLLDILESSCQHSATDERDCVYGLLGHPSSQYEGRLLVSPDYTKTCEQVYMDFAAAILRHPATVVPKNEEWTYGRGRLRLLSFVYHEGLKTSSECASWVPTWNESNPCSTFGNGYYFYAAGNLETLGPITLSGNELHLPGFTVDVIALHTENQLEPQVFEAQLTQHKHGMTQVYEFWRQVIQKKRQNGHISEQDLDEMLIALSLTLTGSILRSESSWSADDNIGQFFANLEAYVSEIRKKGLSDGFTDNEFFTSSFFHRLRMNQVGTGQALIEPMCGDAIRYGLDLVSHCSWRKVFFTKQGRFGLGPFILQEDDICCVFPGAVVPFVLRKDGNRYKLLGEAYLHGVMKGEVIERWQNGKISLEIFHIH